LKKEIDPRMISASDFIQIDYTPDMTLAGINYALQSLPYTYDRMGGDRIKRLQRIVAGKGVELGFQRYLNNCKIRHDMLGATPFTDPDHYDIAIGERHCDIKSYILTQKDRIRLIRREPDQLLDAQALVPCDQITSNHLHDEDIYIFAFLTALMTPNQDMLIKAVDAGQPFHLIHAFPKAWARSKKWSSLGRLVIKSNTSTPIKIELGGQDEENKIQIEQIILHPQKRVKSKSTFFALNYLHTHNMPDGTIGVHSSKLDTTYLVDPMAWGNIWVYGMDIVFSGYITRGEFRQKAQRLPAGSHTFQYNRTRTDNFSLPFRQLHPINELISKAKMASPD
jgi:hypothetical protein